MFTRHKFLFYFWAVSTYFAVCLTHVVQLQFCCLADFIAQFDFTKLTLSRLDQHLKVETDWFTPSRYFQQHGRDLEQAKIIFYTVDTIFICRDQLSVTSASVLSLIRPPYLFSLFLFCLLKMLKYLNIIIFLISNGFMSFSTSYFQ
jgi:hypothetical protein